MAARRRIWTPEVVCQRIQASMLAQRLIDQALGKIEMTDKQLNAAKFLVERILPRAEAPKRIEHSGTVTLERLISGELLAEADDRPSSPSH